MLDVQKQLRGRPPKPPESRRRNNLTIRIRDETRIALQRTANENQRSLSEEAENRLEHSMLAAESSRQIFDYAHGPFVTALLFMVAKIMHDTGSIAGFVSGVSPSDTQKWMSNPYVFNQIAEALRLLFEAIEPQGDIGIPKLKITPPRAHANLDLEKIGANVTLGVLRMITAPARDNSNGELAQWARPIRERLGPETVEQIRAYLDELSSSSLSDLARHRVDRHRKLTPSTGGA
jgi:hypothetical protein